MAKKAGTRKGFVVLNSQSSSDISPKTKCIKIGSKRYIISWKAAFEPELHLTTRNARKHPSSLLRTLNAPKGCDNSPVSYAFNKNGPKGVGDGTTPPSIRQYGPKGPGDGDTPPDNAYGYSPRGIDGIPPPPKIHTPTSVRRYKKKTDFVQKRRK